jgi:outer membrane immunogenic protein
MKRIFIAATLSIMAGGYAIAADLPQPPPPQAPAAYVPVLAPVYNWGGIYVGLNGGYAFGTTNWTPPSGTGPGSFDISGGLVGGTLGANYQMGQFVLGIEADIDWTDISGSTTNTTTCGVTCTFQTSNDWLGTVRGRVGYAWDRVLLFATAGGAFGDVKATLTNPGGAPSTDSTEFGWTAGGGVEVAITDNLTAKAEYLFVDLSNGSLSCTAGVCSGTAITVPVSFETSLIRAGINFKFNGF